MRHTEYITCPVCGTEYDAEYESAPASGPAGEPALDPPVNEWIDEPICPHCGHLYDPDETVDEENAAYLRVGELWSRIQDLINQITKAERRVHELEIE